MRIRYHEGIYYPQEKEKLDEMIGAFIPEKESKAIILPHQSLQRSLPLLKEAFNYAKSKDRIIILSPLHNGRMEDSASFFFEGELLENSHMFHLGAPVNDSFAEEEPSGELLLPLLERVLPEAAFAIVYLDIRNAKESKAFASFLKKYNTPSTLFLISTNLSPKCNTKEECEEYRKNAIHLLEGEDRSILDTMNRKEIAMCGGGIVDALDRIIPGRWKHIASDSDTYTAHSVLIKEEGL